MVGKSDKDSGINGGTVIVFFTVIHSQNGFDELVLVANIIKSQP